MAHDDLEPTLHAGETLPLVGDFAPPFERLGRYEIQSVLGRGGMGVVLKAHDPLLDRDVAIKLLSQDVAANPAARSQFLREARAVGSLHDDHIVPVYTAEEEAGQVYLVMEFVRGGTLEERLTSSKPIRREMMLSIARQATRGLAAAHARGFVHRDLKPSNLLLEPDGHPAGGDAGEWWRVKIADFGLVLDTVGGSAGFIRSGTPGYMSPEQIAGGKVDHRSDLYALGVLLYRMTTGQPPFSGRTNADLLMKHRHDEPLKPSDVAPGAVPPLLEALTLDLLRKKPEERPASANEVLVRLEAIVGDALLPPEERARLEALRRYHVLDADPDAVLADLTLLASSVCGTPIAAITLIDEDRQWMLTGVGLEVRETSRNVSFCTHTICQSDPLIIPDTSRDPRFRGKPFVASEPHIRFYAGVPLVSDSGQALGAVCALDRVPRDITPEQTAALQTIARLVRHHLEWWRERRDGEARVVSPPGPTPS